MAGGPLYVESVVDRKERAARAKTGSGSGSKRSPQGLLASPDGSRIAFVFDDRKGSEIRVDSVASLVAGKPKSVTHGVAELDLAFDAAGGAVAHLTFSREDTTLHRVDLATGKTTSAVLAKEALLPR